MYGYSLQDDLTGKFEFSYKEGKPFLKLLDPTIRKVAAVPEQGYRARSDDTEPPRRKKRKKKRSRAAWACI